MMSRKITVVGSTNIDMVMQVAHLPQLGETVTDATYAQVFGGKGANQAVAAARTGGDVSFVTHLGNDIYVDSIIQNFNEDGIDLSRLYRTDEINSGMALIMFDKSGNNYLSVSPGSNYHLTPDKIDECEALIAESAIVVLQMEIPIESNVRVMELAKKHGVKVMLNLAPARAFDRAWLPYLDYLVVNEVEATMASGVEVYSIESARRASEELLDMGCRGIVVTMGSLGAIYVTREEEIFSPAIKVKAVDTTSAGDTFCGALAVGLTEGMGASEAMRFASVAAGISTTRIGAQPSIPSRGEVMERMRKGR